MKKATVTIGIPAYNEEENIKYLLEDLQKQVISGFVLENILVYSDGSTDKTASFVRDNFSGNNIHIIDNKKRQGLAKVQNELISKSNSDILVLLNADIMIKDPNFIKKLIGPIAENEAGLVSCAMEELKSTSFLGKVLNASMHFKTSVFESYRKGNNIYTCHGTARAFSKRVYKKIKFKDSVGEDAYSYLFALFNGFGYQYIDSTRGYYRLPTNLKDHERQSIRFIQSKKKFVKEFGKNFVIDAYYLPKKLLALTAVKEFLKNPVYMFSYLLIYSYVQIKSINVPKISDKWEISKSSKNLRGYYE